MLRFPTFPLLFADTTGEQAELADATTPDSSHVEKREHGGEK